MTENAAGIGQETEPEKVYEQLRDFLSERFGIAREDVGEDVAFEDLGLDSIDLISASMALEELFGVRIVDEEVENLRTVGNAVDLLAKKRATSTRNA